MCAYPNYRNVGLTNGTTYDLLLCAVLQPWSELQKANLYYAPKPLITKNLLWGSREVS